MKLFGLELTRARGDDEGEGEESGIGQSARSYEAHPYERVLGSLEPHKTLANYKLYEAVIEGVPFLDVGLRKFTRMCAGFEPVADNDALQANLDDFLRTVQVADTQVGFRAFEQRHIRAMLTYGRGIGEIVPTNTGRDLYQLMPIDPKKVRLTRDEEGGILFGEDDGRGGVRAYEAQDLILYDLLNPETDGLFGSSLVRTIPWVANITMTMQQAIRQKWQRHGAPAFVFEDRINADAGLTQKQATKRREEVQKLVKEHFRERWNKQSIIDFVVSTFGEFRATTLGADMKELEFVEPWRAMQEQIVATTELAPFMLGIQWATTERLSQQQADSILSAVDDVRQELTPDWMRVIEFWQQANGLRGTIEPGWREISLQDVVETARANLFEAQADAKRTEVAKQRWQLGFYDQQQAAEYAEGEAVEVAEVLEAPPAAPAPMMGNLADEVRGYWQQYPAVD